MKSTITFLLFFLVGYHSRVLKYHGQYDGLVDAYQSMQPYSSVIMVHRTTTDRRLLRRKGKKRWYGIASSFSDYIMDGDSDSYLRSLQSSSSSSSSTSGGDANNIPISSSSSPSSYLESLSNALQSDDDDIEVTIKRQQEQRRQQWLQEVTGTYCAIVPLTQPLGIRLVQVEPGRVITNRQLDLDTMNMIHVDANNTIKTTHDRYGNVEVLQRDVVIPKLDTTFRGVVVEAIYRDSPAWLCGIRPGHVVQAVSATLGDAVWPKSTLDGILSAVRSRKVLSGSVSFEMRELADTNKVDDGSVYELTLARPLGFQIQDTSEGHVVVSSIPDTASTLVKYAVQVGDRLVAMDASVGGQMWPISSVEGVIAASTSRFPGKAVTIRFQRTHQSQPSTVDGSSAVGQTTVGTAVMEMNTASLTQDSVVAVPSTAATTTDSKVLLKRCRDVLRRYARPDDAIARGGKVPVRSSLSSEIPGMVADKVVDALGSAGSVLDSVTLSMLMNTYIQSNQPEKAIELFEAAVGLPGDGSVQSINSMNAKNKQEGTIKTSNASSGNRLAGIVPNESALNLYTGSILLRSHVVRGDVEAVYRVLLALQGRSGIIVGDSESAPWPWTGIYGSIQLDTRCYNIALSVAEKVGGLAAMEMALSVFDSMDDPGTAVATRSGTVRPLKNVVTYNTMISALTKAGQYDEAFVLFDRMKRAGVRPDKFTYTSLLKACLLEGDVQELLYDMMERGVASDVVTYNTMIRALCDKRQWTKATRLIGEMESRGIAPNSLTYGYIMQAMLNADKPSGCLTLFESACATPKSAPLMQNVHIYTTAITAASVLGNHERALELVSRMTAVGIRPNIKTLTAVMGACLAGNRPDVAAQIYGRIEKPDGYAMAQGIRALSSSGSLESALDTLQAEQRRKDQLLSGKQSMLSYKVVLEQALIRHDFDIARRTWTDLLQKGYIPNKAMYSAITEALKVESVKGAIGTSGTDERDIESFRLLLFILDSLHARNLPIDGMLYATILTLGSRLGKLPRKLASLMIDAKTSADMARKSIIRIDADDGTAMENSGSLRWEEIFDCYDKVRNGLTRDKLQPVPVRMPSRDVRRVIAAEQAVVDRRKAAGVAEAFRSTTITKPTIAGRKTSPPPSSTWS